MSEYEKELGKQMAVLAIEENRLARKTWGGFIHTDQRTSRSYGARGGHASKTSYDKRAKTTRKRDVKISMAAGTVNRVEVKISRAAGTVNRMLNMGLTKPEIAQCLNTSEKTVANMVAKYSLPRQEEV